MNPGYKPFLLNLMQRCRHGESGVMHCYTAQNHYGRLAVVAGAITHVSLHTARAMNALPLLRAETISSHRFEADAKLPPQPDLMNTEAILAALGAAEVALAAATPAIAPTPVAASKPIAAAVSAPAIHSITPAEIQLIQLELQQELGPMAAGLVQEELRRATSAQALAQALADQLIPAEGERFLARVTSLLQLLRIT